LSLGKIIKVIRVDIFGLSLLDFSELMNLSSSALQRYENDDFGVKFNKNKYIKLMDLSERIANAVFNDYRIMRKTKSLYMNSNITKMGFNIKIKEILEKQFLNKNSNSKDKIYKLNNIDVSKETGLIEFIYTFFLFYLGIEVSENINFKKNSNTSFIKIVDTNKDRISDYKNCLTEAKGECFITGTSMVHLSEDSSDLLIEKAKKGIVNLLILDPDWIEKNSNLLTFIDNKEDRKEFNFEIKNSIRKLKALKRNLPDKVSNNITIKTYSTIFPYIITGYDNRTYGKMVVEITDYLPEKNRPRLTLIKNEGDNLYTIIKSKFYSLWNNSNLTKEV
jgi:AraC-like DNA-binding protein